MEGITIAFLVCGAITGICILLITIEEIEFLIPFAVIFGIAGAACLLGIFLSSEPSRGRSNRRPPIPRR